MKTPYVIVFTLVLCIMTAGVYAQRVPQIKKSVKFRTANWNRPELIIRTDQMVTGSGHGYLTAGRLLYKKQNTALGVGLMMQNDYKTISGISAEYNHIVRGLDNIDLYFNFSTGYYHQSLLSVKTNKLVHYACFFDQVCLGQNDFERFNTLEGYGMFGIQINLSGKFFIDTGIGFGGHYSVIQGEDYRNPNSLAREDIAAGLLLRAGLAYRIKI